MALLMQHRCDRCNVRSGSVALPENSGQEMLRAMWLHATQLQKAGWSLAKSPASDLCPSCVAAVQRATSEGKP